MFITDVIIAYQVYNYIIATYVESVPHPLEDIICASFIIIRGPSFAKRVNKLKNSSYLIHQHHEGAADTRLELLRTTMFENNVQQ
jgi:glycerol-3-phosphate dehydrogenase